MQVAYNYRALYGTTRWRETSALVIARAGGMCQVTPGCWNRATTADHVIPALVLSERGRLGLFFDLDNLIAACRSCNSRAGARLINSRRRGKRMPRRRLRWEDVDGRAALWAERENAYWAQLERERRDGELVPAESLRQPRIY